MNINTEHLRSLLGSEEAAQRFVTLFRQQLPQQLESLRQALSESDWDTASNTAHGLKSQCRYLGLDEAADSLQELENDPKMRQDLSFIDALARM
ncbi:MAG: Hpt domain-containing protein [Phycisphaerae bacterium]|nr:Hpt domain-containing protein [Saprospiraceae bacterium]